MYWYNIDSDFCGKIIDKFDIIVEYTYGIHATLMRIFGEEGDVLVCHCCYTTPDSFFQELVCIFFFRISQPVFVKQPLPEYSYNLLNLIKVVININLRDKKQSRSCPGHPAGICSRV